MARLSILNNDIDHWGAIPNEFLRISHRGDGTLKKASEIVSVQDFGGVGDGVADNTAAIQAALNAAKGADGIAAGRRAFSPQHARWFLQSDRHAGDRRCKRAGSP